MATYKPSGRQYVVLVCRHWGNSTVELDESNQWHPISYFEGSLLHCRRVSLGSDSDMEDLGSAGTWPSVMAGPADEKEAAAAAMPAATKWEEEEEDWCPDLENLNET